MKTAFKFQISVVVISAGLLLFANSKEVLGQTQRSFTLSPPTIKFTLKPGKTAEKKIKITNNSDVPLEFTANVIDFIVTDKNGTPELLPAGVKMDNKFAASYWTTVLPDNFVVAPKKSETVTLYLQVPGNASPGGRYVSVAFRPNSSGNKLDQTGAAVNTVGASLVYVTVEGKMTEGARIEKFSAPSLSEFGPVPITTEIKNTGDIHISPRGTVVVKGLFGIKVYSGALANLNVFPGTSRVYENIINKKILFGPFKAKLDGYYGTANNLPLIASNTFWVIPYKFILIIAIAIGTAFWLSSYLHRKNEEEMEVKETETPPTTEKKEKK